MPIINSWVGEQFEQDANLTFKNDQSQFPSNWLELFIQYMTYVGDGLYLYLRPLQWDSLFLITWPHGLESASLKVSICARAVVVRHCTSSL